MNRLPSLRRPISLAVWYGKGGVGKSTSTLLLSLLAAKSGKRVLAVDLDPECGTSRDFLGNELRRLPESLISFLSAPMTLPPPIVSTGVPNLDLVPTPPDEQRFFRHFGEHSTRLRDGLALVPPVYDYVLMDVPNQFDNIAELGLIAAQYVILPVELTADCLERIPTVLRVLREATAINPRLHVLGALVLASAPRAGQELGLSAKERLVLREYEAALRNAHITPFRTIMFRTATSVEEARSNADDRLLHWTARRRFQRLFVEIHTRIRTHQATLSQPPYGQPPRYQRRRGKARTHA
jgi:chromosome partitioning protein